MLGALLAGVRRAFPFVEASEAEALVAAHSPALFKIVHTATFGVAVQARPLCDDCQNSMHEGICFEAQSPNSLPPCAVIQLQ